MSLDYTGAASFALNYLKHNLPDNLHYHNVSHTQDVVVPAAGRLAQMHDLSKEQSALVVTAAWFHDTGFSFRYHQHEESSARLAEEVLPKFGYTDEQIKVVKTIIMATKMPHQPKTLVEAIIADADMDMLGQPGFIPTGNQLRREEYDWHGRTYTDEEWYEFEMNFLKQHRYFTEPQRRHRNSGKIQNYLTFARALMNERQRLSPPPTAHHGKRDTQPFEPL